MEHSNKIIKTTLAARTYKSTSSDLADSIGTLDRDTYVALIKDWKADYKTICEEIRQAKVNRKGRDQNEGARWQGKRESLRVDARQFLLVREAISELGRRHWAAKQALAA